MGHYDHCDGCVFLRRGRLHSWDTNNVANRSYNAIEPGPTKIRRLTPAAFLLP
jgi:hypothetical protein